MKHPVYLRPTILALLIICLLITRLSAQTIVYVDSSATGANNGTSWSNAYNDLQPALLAAGGGQVLWVAKGTYYPTTDTNRLKYFVLKNGVSMYGGFAGNETSIAQRNIAANPTILSGDIGRRNDTTDNSNHVVYAQYISYNTVFDGFVVEYGHGTVDMPPSQTDAGGGMYAEEASFQISNCLFRYNFSFSGGGGIYEQNSNLLVTGCTFYQNSSGQAGGVHGYNSYSIMRNCTFLENTAYGPNNPSAGAMTTGGWDIYNCTFRKNYAKSAGGALLLESGTHLYGCLFDSNYCSYQGGAIYSTSGSVQLYKCTFTNNYTTAPLSTGGAINFYGAFSGGIYSSDIDNCLFANNRAAGDGGGIYIYYFPTRIRNCIFNNNYSHRCGGGINFNSGNYTLSVINSTFVKNTADSLGNAIFDYNIWYNSTPVTNCIFSHNGMPEIYYPSNALVTKVQFSLTQTSTAGVGNITTPPVFVDTIGADGTPGTADDNLHLQALSPGIDQGNKDSCYNLLGPDDFDGNPRIINTIDMGAYEWNSCSNTISPAIAGDDTVLCGSYTQAQLYSTLPQNGSGMWSVIEGYGTVDSIFSNSSPIFDVLSGTTKVLWSVQYCGVVVSDTVTISKAGAIAAPTISANGPLAFCPGGSVVLSVPAGYSQYLWSNGASVSSVTASASGSYSVSVTDNGGCTANSASSVTVTVYATPGKPVISFTGDTILCGNETIALHAPAGYSGYAWSNGSTAQTIVVSSAGRFNVQVKNSSGCWSVRSDTVRLVQFSSPPKPGLTIADSSIFCSGDSVTITAPAGYVNYNWNNGMHTPSVTLYDTYNLYLSVIDNHGCASPNSDTVAAQKITLAAPVITAGGSLSFCSGDSVTLSAPAGFSAYSWSTGSTGASISVQTQGNYQVQVQNALGCNSPQSSPTAVTVYSLPAKPVITFSGSASICQGQSVLLNAPSGMSSYSWSNGSNSNPISVSSSGTYTVWVANSWGCNSPVSDPVQVVVNAIPATPVITESGSEAFCSGDSDVLSGPTGFQGYRWSNGSTNSSIIVRTSGNYTVDVTDNHGCVSQVSDAIQITVYSNPAIPVIAVAPLGNVCAGDSVVLSVSRGSLTYYWSNGKSGQTQTVRKDSTLYVYAFDGNCRSANSTPATVIFTPVSAAPVISVQGGTAITTNDTAAHYFWLLNDSLIATDVQTISALQQGTYDLVTETNGCFSDTSNAITVGCAMGPVAQQVSIGPNPNDGNFILEIDGYKSTDVKASLYDILGQKLTGEVDYSTEACAHSSFVFSFPELPKGVYFMRLNLSGKIITKSWVKAR